MLQLVVVVVITKQHWQVKEKAVSQILQLVLRKEEGVVVQVQGQVQVQPAQLLSAPVG